MAKTDEKVTRSAGTSKRSQKSASFSEEELAELKWAYEHLEHPSLAARMSSLLAIPIEEGMSLLPKSWRNQLDRVAQASICQVLKTNLSSQQLLLPGQANHWAHKFLVAGVGAVGGFFGPLTLLAELPIVTVLILRAIADVARAEGEDLSSPETRLACAQVFAFGGRTRADDKADTGYYGLRIALGMHFERDVIEFAAGANGPHIPVTINFIRAIAARFGVVITDRAAARMVPVAGAASGAALNLIFMNHYQNVARGHFILRRLERAYGIDAVRNAYQEMENAEDMQENSPFASVDGW